MKKIREINRRNRILKSKYKGDERFVRIHKRIEEQNEKREKPIISKQEYEIAENLANMKQDIDRMIFSTSTSSTMCRLSSRMCLPSLARNC